MLVAKFPTNNLEYLISYTGFALSNATGNWERWKLRRRRSLNGSVLNRLGITSSGNIPATPGVELGPTKRNVGREETHRIEDLGILMWISPITRLDISHAVRAVARHSHNPVKTLNDSHKRLVIPSRNQRGLGLTFVRGFGIGFDCPVMLTTPGSATTG